jgi:hypothetical protein
LLLLHASFFARRDDFPFGGAGNFACRRLSGGAVCGTCFSLFVTNKLSTFHSHVANRPITNSPDTVWKIASSSAPPRIPDPAGIRFRANVTASIHIDRPIGLKTRDNGAVPTVPRAFVHQSQFKAAIARAQKRVASDVVSIIPTLGDDWSGEPAVFFMVILSDAASKRDQLLSVTDRVSKTIVREVEPLEAWGVLPYFNFRSQSEQAKLNEPTLA